MKRREFGTKILQTAAALGLTRVSPAILSGLGIPLVDCASDGPGAGSSSESFYGSVGQVGDAPEPVSRAMLGKQQPTVIIIGSGYGAAVTSLRLTEAGIPVTIFEMGRMWNEVGDDGKIFCANTEPDGRAVWFKDTVEAFGKDTGIAVPRQAGVLDIVGPQTMRVSLGRGFGGGSLVNLAVFADPVREVLGRVLPNVSMDDMYGKYFPRAKQFLRASQCPEDILQANVYQYSRTGIAAARAAGIDCIRVTSGYDYDYMRQEIAGTVPRSATGGEGGFGNNYGKRSLNKSYFADAMGTGLLTVNALHEVTRITRSNDGYVVRTKQIDIEGRVLAEVDHPCTHLFLCGGSMGTSALLTRARERGDLPDLNRAVGTEWGPNSDIFVARSNSLWYPTGAEQCILPSSAFYTRDNRGKHVFSMIIPLPIGIETFISFNIVMTESPEAGHFVYNSSTDTADLVWAQGQNDPAVRSARDVFDKINLATGAIYNEELCSDRSTYHPVGGCPIGRATDDYGRIPNYPGLYVQDGSLLPVGIGANPSLTITALAERNMERILAEDFGV